MIPQKTLIVLVIVLALGFVGYKVIGGSSEGAGTANTVVVGQDILLLVEKLRGISIDTTIFSSALFNNLRDYSIPLVPESQGRPNPFALIGSDFSFVSSPTVSATTTGR